MQLTDQEKIRLLNKELETLKRQQDNKISHALLEDYLDMKVWILTQLGYQFDRTVLEQLLERIPKSQNNLFTIENFVSVWLEADKILKTKIDSITQQTNEYIPCREVILKKLEKAKQEQVNNEYNIMEVNLQNQGSILTVKVGKGAGIWGPQDLKLELHFGNEFQETKYLKGPHLFWDQKFSFTVTTGEEQLRLVVKNAHNQTFGEKILPIQLFQDQQTHNETYQCDNNKVKEILQGQIELSVQWIHSKIKLFEDYLEYMFETNQQFLEDLQDFKNNLQILYQPFQSLIPQSIPKKSTLILPEQKKSFEIPQQHSVVEFNTCYEDFVERKDDFKYLELISLSLLVLSIFNSFGRTQFLEQLGCICFLYLAAKKQLSEKIFYLFLIGLFIDFIVDIIWISYYIQGFQVQDFGLGVLKFSVVMSIFMIILKGMFGLGLGYHVLSEKHILF